MLKDLLGGLSPSLFLKRHWQLQPLLIRQAIPDFRDLLTPRQLMSLAGNDMCQARLIVTESSRTEVHYGPFSPRIFRGLPGTQWTLLVQGVNHALPAADRLLRSFSFLPFSRLDDLMVSYAVPGGGVGPHFDSYDVFLLQGKGRRRWQVSAQTDLELVPGLDLRILKRFSPQGECILGRGDMLYLPPRFAHDGVAVDPCLTYSIGFRAPAFDELKSEFFAYLEDTIRIEGRYADPGLAQPLHPAELGDRMISQVAAALSRIRWDRSDIISFLGRHLSEPKAGIVLQPPARISLRDFSRRARAHGLEVHPALPLLFKRKQAFINGETFELSPQVYDTITKLADKRRLDSHELRGAQLASGLLYNWYLSGYVNLGERSAK